MNPTIVVIGAGAAGIIAAYTAAQAGARVTLLEKTDRVGTKILVSGGGKCNITHDGPLEEVLRAFRPNEARFIRPACYRFPPQEIVRMLTDRGLEVYTRPNGRIFPVHQTAKDVCRILHDYLLEAGVDIRLETPVESITKTDQGFKIQTNRGPLSTDQLILCVGGSSYPKTGTTGDGFPWVKQLGHTLVPIRAALAPMEMDLQDREPKAGTALRDCILKARQNGKELARWRDDLLFTHRGVSGPTVLGISREVAEVVHHAPVHLEADLLPDQNFEQLSEKIKAWKAKNPNKQIDTLIDEYLPQRLTPDFLADLNLNPTVRMQQLSKKDLNRIVEALKGWNLGRVKNVVLPKGEVVAGGVALEEVDPQTMRSQKVSGLYLCGEILDIAGPVGGYNLQAAWATGYIAGETAAQDWQD